MTRFVAACAVTLMLLPAARAAAVAAAKSTPATPSIGHVVVVVMENHSYPEIIGNRAAPYLNQLARHGLLLTRMHGITHPSQPNYVGLFSGATHHVLTDGCPRTVRSDNLGSQLRARGYQFAGYAEGLPHRGSQICVKGEYLRRHAPWVDFPNLPRRISLPFAAFPKRYAALPTVSFVTPNARHDMHDGTIAQGDHWVRRHLAGYAHWARTHASLLIVTWDEDDHTTRNHIPTIISGAGIRPGRVARQLTLYSLLRLLETTYRLPLLGHARTAPAIPLR